MSLYDHDAAVRKKQKARQLHTQMLLETFLDKCIEVREKKKVMIEAKKVQKEIDKVKKDIADLYTHSMKNETELKMHIASLRARIYPKISDKETEMKLIDEMSQKNIKYLVGFQNYKKGELQSAKDELEIKVIDDFQALIHAQADKMNKQINSEKTIFDRMYDTKDQLSLIKDDFQNKNIQYQQLFNEHTQLKIEKEIKEKEKKQLKKILLEQKKLNEELSKKLHIETADTINEEDIDDDDKDEPITTNRNCRTMTTCFSASTLNTKHLSSINSMGTVTHVQMDMSDIAMFLSEKNRDINKVYQQTKYRNNNIIREKSQLSQFLQRCIDDLKVDYQYLEKKMNRENTIPEIKKYKLNQIQTKITKLSFIYDNLFLYENKQNKTKKRKSHSIMLSRSKTNKTLVLKTTTFFSPKNQSRNKKLIRLKSK